jgi:uncharacterized membrane protein
MLSKVVRVSWTDKNVRTSLKVLSVYFVIFMLYQSGFVYQVAEGYSGSISIGQEEIKEYGDANQKASFYSLYHPEQDVFSAKWLSKRRNHEKKVYAIYNGIRVHPLVSYGMISRSETPVLTNTTKKIKEGSYVYLHYLNVVEGIGTDWHERSIYNMTEIYPLIKNKNKIYSNGGAQVYYR